VAGLDSNWAIRDTEIFSAFVFEPGAMFSARAGEAKMLDEPLSASLDRELTINIVAAYVRRNQIGSDHSER
jgi:hypothetical protein